MFREELVHIAEACHELMVSGDDLWCFEIDEGCTIGRLFTVVRILRFYGVLRRQELSRIQEVDEEIYIGSTMPGGHVREFSQLLEAHGVSKPYRRIHETLQLVPRVAQSFRPTVHPHSSTWPDNRAPSDDPTELQPVWNLFPFTRNGARSTTPGGIH